MSPLFRFQKAVRFLFQLQTLLATHTPIKATPDSEAPGGPQQWGFRQARLVTQAQQAEHIFKRVGDRPKSCRPQPELPGQ